MKRRVYSIMSGSRAARTSVVLALSLLPIGALLAQNEDADALADLEACAAIERSNARLACYDGVLGRPPSPQSPAASAGAGAGMSSAAAAAPEAAESATPPPPPATDSDRQSIVVTELRLRTPTKAVFTAANGQVWEQTDNLRGRYPETPFEATLERGALNSTFLVSPSGGPRIRVRLRQ